ncbi:AAA family ATPase [Ornithobacterium rhinotracheale]|uniref:AAA family ATPase n=1 Tax=Ornithobacterium rhinotracheale TaxID=28251 RepID=UPI0040351145
MDKKQIQIELKDVRAIKKANIILDGITVIAGENGSGKSTISRLAYHLFLISIRFDEIIEEKLRGELFRVSRTLDHLMQDLSYIVSEDELSVLRKQIRLSLLNGKNTFVEKKICFFQ